MHNLLMPVQNNTDDGVVARRIADAIIFILKIWHPISISGQHEEMWTRSALPPKTKINKQSSRQNI